MNGIIPPNYRQRSKKNKEISLNQENLPVAIKEEMFDIIYYVHVQTAHFGMNKTFEHLQMRYHGITEKISNALCRLCPTSNLKAKQYTQPRIKPIRSRNFLERFQIDLINISHAKLEFNSRRYVDKNSTTKIMDLFKRYYEWICHVIENSIYFGLKRQRLWKKQLIILRNMF